MVCYLRVSRKVIGPADFSSGKTINFEEDMIKGDKMLKGDDFFLD